MPSPSPPGPGGTILTTLSPDSTLLALHVPTPPSSSSSFLASSGSAAASGSTTRRLTVRLYDASVSLSSLRTTLVATVDGDDGEVSEMNFDSHSSSSSSSSSSTEEDGGETLPPNFLCVRLGTGKVIVWDLNRGVPCATVAPPNPSSSIRGVAVHDGHLFGLTVQDDTGRVQVMEYDLSTTSGGGANKLVRKIKCPSIDAATDDDDNNDAGDLPMGIALGGSYLAVRTGGAMRILDVDSGKKAGKCKVPKVAADAAAAGAAAGGSGGGGSESSSDGRVIFSSDSKLVATVTPTGLYVYSAEDGGRPRWSILNKDIGGTQRSQLQSVSMRNIEGEGRYAALTTAASGRALLHELASGRGGGKNAKDARLACTFQCGAAAEGAPAGDGGSSAVVAAAGFHSTDPGSKVVAVTMPATSASGGSAASMLGQVAIRELGYRDINGDLKVGEVTVAPPAIDADGAEGGDKSKKKRRAAASLPAGDVVLGPGEGGAEALMVTDANAGGGAKRAKTGGGDDDDDDDDDDDEFVLPEGGDDDGELGAGPGASTSIADRLAALTSEMGRDSDDDSDDQGDKSDDEDDKDDLLQKGTRKLKLKFKAKNATSESLSTLLTQSLKSNDDAKLEVALHVSDKKVIENSISALLKADAEAAANGDDDDDDDKSGGGLVVALLSKLVERLAMRPGRAEDMSFWIRTVLVAIVSGGGGSDADGSSGRGGRNSSGGNSGSALAMGRAERDVARRLGPLRNLLNDRVESLPHLLRLEGRLALLGQQL